MSSMHEAQWMMPQEPTPIMRLAVEDLSAEAFVDEGLEWLDESSDAVEESAVVRLGLDRRAFRRFDLESWDVSVEHCDDAEDAVVLGRVLDLSAGGVRLRTTRAGLHRDQQIKVRLALPSNNGLSPFVALVDGHAKPKHEWVGWLEVTRVTPEPGGTFEVGGRLIDMEAMDRGMLGLYLSAQRMAA